MTQAIETIGGTVFSPGSVTVLGDVRMTIATRPRRRSVKRRPAKGSEAWFKANFSRLKSAAQANTQKLTGKPAL